jgi:2-polyprenyl-6-methoxyphenol hydroxylase-like FAD-dependent oxidoreductase
MLLGDAAHPMLPYAGQGAAQALEDAFALVNAYKKHGPSNIESIFRDYEHERIPRSSKVMQFARDIDTFAHHHGLLKVNRDTLLRQHDMNDFYMLKWLYADESTNEE